MKYLIDTDRVIDYLQGKEPAIELLESFAQDGAAISLITYGEIYEGVYYGKSRERHEQGFRRFLQIVDVVSLNASILEEFARIRGLLRSQGQIIGDLDLLIAATALHHDLIVVTRNVRHFVRIPELQLYAE